MDCMENGDVLNTRYDKWFDTAANMLQMMGRELGAAFNKHVCLLEQTENG